MAIPRGLCSYKALAHAETFYEISRGQIREGLIARPIIERTGLLAKQVGYTPGCNLDNMYSDTIALRQVSANFNSAAKARVEKIVRENFNVLEPYGYYDPSFLSKAKRKVGLLLSK